MSTNKLFDNWVSKNFNGLSAATLCQLIGMQCMLAKEWIDSMVYVDLFHYFTGSRLDQNVNTFEFCKDVVKYCEWL